MIPAGVPGTDDTFTIARLQPNRENPSLSRVTLDVAGGSAAAAARPKTETLVIVASIKPYINLVWMGTITLIVGFIVTIVRRVEEARGKGA